MMTESMAQQPSALMAVWGRGWGEGVSPAVSNHIPTIGS